jgi:hypothetical protein
MHFKQIVSVLVFLHAISLGVGWGEDGHKIIAQIAADMVSSGVMNTIDTYIGSETLADIAPMPDDYDHTPQGKWSAPCHFVNMPQGALNFTLADCGDTCCVVKAIMNYTQRLTTENNNDPQPCNFDQGVEPCALEFLVHFVGDSHQPLHVGYGYDEGGNDVQVTWYGETTNLHKVWDDEIIDRWDSDWEDAVSQLESMMQNEPNTVKYYASVTSPVIWADESFSYVRSTCYNFTTSDDEKYLKLNPADELSLRQGVPALGDTYYNRNLPIVQQRLIAAGVRLAYLLGQILGGGKRIIF